jgi:ribonucleoside-diphosphate reductase alpha chain
LQSIESIFETHKDAALIHQTGGGTGFSFIKLRPRGDSIFSVKGAADGALAFVSLYDNAIFLIDRTRVRPSANMAVLHVSHPDIEQVFLTAMQMPVKCVTVYRDHSCEEQVLAACSIKREECS